jgi:RNA polymerase sigma-70 factor (ECF subfamily)
MKTFTILAATALILCAALTGRAQTPAPTVETVAPVVVKTVPEAGSKDVAPGTVEIKVTFSKEMADGSWSWSSTWKDSTPEGLGKPHYEADKKTCVFKVKLEPGRTYGYWINNQSFKNFKDQQGHSAVPYLLVFQTKG